MPELKGRAVDNFLQGIGNEETKEGYLIKLRLFLEHAGVSPDEFVSLAKRKPKEAERLITEYVVSRKGAVSGATLRNFKAALKLFLAMNDVGDALNWTRIGKVMPTARRHGSDRAPTAEELRRILDSCDLRMKCVVLLMVSSGMRVGSFDWLKWGDVQPVKSGKHEFAKLRVYRGENEEYHTFITPECYRYLLDYKAMREKAGEAVNDGSPLIRDGWGNYRGAKEAGEAVAVTAKTLRNQLGILYRKIGLRETKEGARYEFKQVHGFRKFFKSNSERFMKSIYVEILMGHSTGVSDSYMKPQEEDMLEEYVKAIPALTVLTKEGPTVEDLDEVKRQARVEALKVVAESMGIDPEKVKVEKMEGLSPEEEERLIKQLIREEMESRKEGESDPQRIIREAELEAHLKEGWQFVCVLPSKRILVRK